MRRAASGLSAQQIQDRVTVLAFCLVVPFAGAVLALSPVLR